jgi:hypothetical protein
MGHAIVGEEDGVTFIQCYRGSSRPEANSIVSDRQGNEWCCKMTKREFDRQKDDYVVEVFDEKVVKKFLKSFLTFKKDI